ncbi:hypothetical protein D9758_009212 [Tetrapyrgos nigripes]|uniref:Uncharacterized protein n=1 Tax=Tetrapyrgos nigripes TaxID=182062 RepID=A0A8H5D211_9AGAR|nr:hypothetical protein D9758_009212 [Tetrapyrgos nigripes]
MIFTHIYKPCPDTWFPISTSSSLGPAYKLLECLETTWNYKQGNPMRLEVKNTRACFTFANPDDAVSFYLNPGILKNWTRSWGIEPPDLSHVAAMKLGATKALCTDGFKDKQISLIHLHDLFSVFGKAPTNYIMITEKPVFNHNWYLIDY